MPQIDLVAKKKNNVTVSNSGPSSSAGLQAIHTVKDPVTWDVPNDTLAWIKVGAYENYQIERIKFAYTGTATSFFIERSINNFEWDILSPTFLFDPNETEVDITYANTKEFVWIRLNVNNPVGFDITDFEVYTTVTIVNTEIISHNFFTLYDPRERAEHPFFPSIVRNLLEQWEAFPDLDLKLFKASDFENSDITRVNVSGGTDITLTGSNIPIDTEIQYIWDFDDPNVVHITGADGIINLTSTNDKILATDVDFSAFSANEFVGKQLEITSGVLNKREFLIDAHTVFATGNTITVDSGDAFTASETLVDYQIKDVTAAAALANPNIIITANPLATQQHSYLISGEYVPRLVLIHPKYSLEWTEFFKVL